MVCDACAWWAARECVAEARRHRPTVRSSLGRSAVGGSISRRTAPAQPSPQTALSGTAAASASKTPAAGDTSCHPARRRAACCPPLAIAAGAGRSEESRCPVSPSGTRDSVRPGLMEQRARAAGPGRGRRWLGLEAESSCRLTSGCRAPDAYQRFSQHSVALRDASACWGASPNALRAAPARALGQTLGRSTW